MLPNTTPRINKIQQKNSVRQTVLSGPVDASGKEDFLEIVTGLEVLSKSLSTDPLILSFGDGFTETGQKDFTIEVSEQLNWGALPASEAEVFLYIDLLTDGTVQTGHSIVEPVYSLARPATPATGQAFYSTYHTGRMEVFNGSSWVPVLRVFVGQCVTDATSVTSIEMYAYGTGRGYEAPLGSGQKWRELISERSVSTLYTNNTGRAIFVAVVGNTLSGTNGNALQFLLNGTKIDSLNHDSGSIGRNKSVSALVPHGSTYQIEAPIVSLFTWRELR